jgi:hypothetical protein
MGMANIPPLVMKLALPVPLMELLAISLSNLKTIAKWLVISPALSRKRARGVMSRVASSTFIVLCALSAGNADAANWVKVVDSKTSRVFVDTSSINRTGDIVTAWYKRDFNQPMVSEKNRPPYKSSKVLNYYNCSDREIATAQWITYANKDGLGKAISNQKVISLEYGDVPPGETGEAVFDFVCKYVKPEM